MNYTQVSEETALQWLKRVQRNRRHLNQNPICFPEFSKSTEQENEDCDVLSAAKMPSSSPDRFVVTPANILKLSSQTWLSDFSLLNEISSRSKRWRRRRLHSRIGDQIQDFCASENDPLAALEASLLESFPNGSGLPFLDSILSSSGKNENNDGFFLDIIGSCRDVLTHICTRVLASYSASTSLGCFNEFNTVSSPPIVLIDPECTLSLTDVIATVKTEVLRRWNATDSYRCRMKYCLTKSEGIDIDNQLESPENDYKHIEQDIQSVLGRIHIIRPRDILHGCISTMESLFHLLDLQSKRQNAEIAPAMVVLVSALDAFSPTTKLKESLPDGSGLSGCTDFLRHLSRLKSKYNAIVVSTTLCNFDAWGNPKTIRNAFERFDKMATHQISIIKCQCDSVEYREGFDYMAKLNSQSGASKNVKIPFAMTR